MMQYLWIPIFLAAGLACGLGLWAFFRRMPAVWLLDYGETEITAGLAACKNLPVVPDALLLMAADALIFTLAWWFLGAALQLPVVLLAAQPLLLVMVADYKTRIIPDQFVLALLPCGGLFWLTDGLSGDPGWLPGLIERLLGGLAGGLVLFLCGWLGEKLLKREAMGMGDVKLLAACGLLAGLSRLPMLLVLSFFTAAFVALPLLLRRLRHPEAGSDMAFGPYIALAALMVMLLSKPIFQLWSWYLDMMV